MSSLVSLADAQKQFCRRKLTGKKEGACQDVSHLPSPARWTGHPTLTRNGAVLYNFNINICFRNLHLFETPQNFVSTKQIKFQSQPMNRDANKGTYATQFARSSNRLRPNTRRNTKYKTRKETSSQNVSASLAALTTIMVGIRASASDTRAPRHCAMSPCP